MTFRARFIQETTDSFINRKPADSGVSPPVCLLSAMPAGGMAVYYSTVTDFARLRGMSTFLPLLMAM